MSETPQGPGWWLASDGRWYPPQLRPASETLVRPAGASEPQGPGWWLASDGRWYPPQLHPDVLGAEGAPPAEPEHEPEPAVSAAPAGGAAPVDAEQAPALVRPRRRRRLAGLAGVVAAAGLAAGLALALLPPTTPTRPSTTSPGLPAHGRIPAGAGGAPAPTVRSWSAPALHVLSPPVAAGGQVLVLAAAPTGGMELVAVDPGTGVERWSVAYSPSAIPPQETIAPVAVGHVALVLSPSGGPTASTVVLQGVDVTSGRQLWSSSAPTAVVDAPVPCPSDESFCVVTATATGATRLEVLSAADGTVSDSVAGPQTEMAPGLYTTSTSPPALEAVSPSGEAAWSEPLSVLFGGSQYSTGYGWDFVTAGDLDVGTIGVEPQGTSEPLGQLKTLGLSAADGTVAWSAPGALDCFGVLPVSAPFLCRYSGSARYLNGTLSTSGVALTVSGLDESSGKATWSVPLADAGAMSSGNGLPIADATHVVVPLSSGPALLDLVTGTTGPAPAGEPMWCGQAQLTRLSAAPAALAGGLRVTATLYSPCTAAGTPTSALPAHALPAMGAEAGGMFVWGSPQGLEGSSLPH